MTIFASLTAPLFVAFLFNSCTVIAVFRCGELSIRKPPPPPPTDCEFSDALITKCLTNSCRSQDVLKAHHGTFLKAPMTRCPVTQTLWKLATKVLSAFESAFQVESDFPWAQKGNVLPPSVLNTKRLKLSVAHYKL